MSRQRRHYFTASAEDNLHCQRCGTDCGPIGLWGCLCPGWEEKPAPTTAPAARRKPEQLVLPAGSAR